jgi:hypothetical protein
MITTDDATLRVLLMAAYRIDYDVDVCGILPSTSLAQPLPIDKTSPDY